MKKIIGLFVTALLSVSMLFTSCSKPEGESETAVLLPAADETVPEGYLRINYAGSGENYLWIWKDIDSTESAKCVSWNAGGIKFDRQNGSYQCVDVKLASGATCIGLIVKSYDGNTKYTGNSDLMFYFPNKYNQIYLTNGPTIYTNAERTKEPVGTSSASISGNKEITLNCNEVTLNNENVTLKDKNGNAVAISTYGEKTINVTDSLKSSYATNSPFTLTVKDNEGTIDTLVVGVDSSLVESWFGKVASNSLTVTGEIQPGVTINGSKATFKTWSPIASKAQLLLFTDAEHLTAPATDPIDMELDTNGFWTVEDVDITGYKYYKYRIENSSVVKDVSDIWAKVASGNSVASQIIDINDDATKPENWETSYTNPFGSSGTEIKKYSDAIIYEMHIRDWSRAFASDSLGKFQDITNALKDNGEFAKHLKDLGVTHVQILPMFDHAETNESTAYNWGYNPYQYNVPEGRYTKYGTEKDGSDSVLQMREMIKAFHDAGIAVNMDVVYNHTSGTGDGSLYDMTVPKYFYRFDSQGSYSNGSGCGNEINTKNKMVLRYVVESLKHWMTDYHINGFRFDLMGCHEIATMQEIYNELYKIDPNVMVYGEPWPGGTSQVSKGCAGAVKSSDSGYGIGAFDDNFRDAIKGKEFGGFGKGQLQGDYKDTAIIAGLKGDVGVDKRNETGILGLALHYAECHDNYTLFDKLAMSYLNLTDINGHEDLFAKLNEKGLSTVKQQEKLAAAYIFLSQGTPFMNGGQEFLRTKQGDKNSYSSADSVNQINLSFATTYSDVYKTYKGLIALRKANSDAFGSNSLAAATKMKDGITKYTTGDFLVYFNATDEAYTCDATGYSKSIDVSSGAPVEGAAVTSVPAKGFVILKK